MKRLVTILLLASATVVQAAATLPTTQAPDSAWLRKVFGDNEQISVQCGPAPPPPPGCRVGACVCDSTGNNCQWQMICR